MFNRTNIIAWLERIVPYMYNLTGNDRCGCAYYIIETTKINNYALVIGFDDEDELSIKLAFQPRNSLLQCDFDIDWLMPYNDETGEVWDTSITIDPRDDFEKIIDWFENQWSAMRKNSVVPIF